MAKAKVLAAALFLALLLSFEITPMGIMESIERKFVFFPTPVVERTPALAGLNYEEVYFSTDNDVKLHGWYVPASLAESTDLSDPEATASAPLTLLWFHGNGGNIGHRVNDLAQLNRRLGVNIFIFDYRGYGYSEGRPSETGVYQDAWAALNYLRSRPDVDSKGIIFFGRSLGTAVAVRLASELAVAPFRGEPPRALILVSPFTSLGDMARFYYPWLPLGRLAGHRFDSLARIDAIDCPLLVIHSEADKTIPVEQGRRLFAAAAEPKHFLTLTNYGHNDGLDLEDGALRQGLAGFLSALPSSD